MRNYAEQLSKAYRVRGGILADKIGYGKTVRTLELRDARDPIPKNGKENGKLKGGVGYNIGLQVYELGPKVCKYYLHQTIWIPR